MWTKISAALQVAADTVAPPVPLLHDFTYHWRALMRFYDNQSEALNVPIESTHIPVHLEEMLKALQEEQGELRRYNEETAASDTGPCLEYLLQHRVPDLLASLACADTPSGMRHLGLVFFSRLVSMTSQHLLPHSALHEPVQRMLKLCGQTAASPTEPQEVRMLCVLSAVIGQQPQLAKLFCLRPQESSAEASPEHQGATSKSYEGEMARRDNLLVDALLRYVDTADGRIRVKVCEALLILASLPDTAHSLAQDTSLATVLAQRLARLYRAIPGYVDPGDFDELQASWGMDSPLEERDQFPGCRPCGAFLSWLDFCDRLISDSQPEVSSALVSSIQRHFLCAELQSRVAAGTETLLTCGEELEDLAIKGAQDCIISLVQLARLMRQCKAPLLRDGLAHWLVSGMDASHTSPRTRRDQAPEGMQAEAGSADEPMARTLLRLLTEAQGDVGLEVMRFFEVVVEQPYSIVLQALVFSHLEESRNYSTETRGVTSNVPESTESLPGSSAEDGSSVASGGAAGNKIMYPPSRILAPTNIHQVLEGFLQLLPSSLRSGEEGEGGGGYESYLQDAQRQYAASWARCSPLAWPLEVAAPDDFNADDASSSDSRPEADLPEWRSGGEGPLLRALLARLEAFPQQEYELNLQLTALLSRLALLPHAGLHALLLAPGTLLAASLRRLAATLAEQAPRIPGLSRRLRATRQRLLGDAEEEQQDATAAGLEPSQESVLESAVVLEEFCKELAAIAFVKYHLHAPS